MADVNFMIDGHFVECVEIETGYGYDVYVDDGDDPINLGEIWWCADTPTRREVREFIACWEDVNETVKN